MIRKQMIFTATTIGNITIIYTMNNASHVSNVFQSSQPDFGLDERYR